MCIAESSQISLCTLSQEVELLHHLEKLESLQVPKYLLMSLDAGMVERSAPPGGSPGRGGT